MKLKIAFLLLIIFSACDENPVITTGYNFSDSVGVYIVNEGNYMQDNATLSFLNLESMMVYNNVFFSANETRLGDVAYSMLINGNKGYIVINNSGRIYSINIRNAKFNGQLTGFISQRN